MFEFYETMYKYNCLTKNDLKKACKYDVITKDEYKKIVGEEYVE